MYFTQGQFVLVAGCSNPAARFVRFTDRLQERAIISWLDDEVEQHDLTHDGCSCGEFGTPSGAPVAIHDYLAHIADVSVPVSDLVRGTAVDPAEWAMLAEHLESIVGNWPIVQRQVYFVPSEVRETVNFYFGSASALCDVENMLAKLQEGVQAVSEAIEERRLQLPSETLD